jgi:hypothetical protein
MKSLCPICEKRKPERFCPAKGEKICAVCCGREREITIDCPSHCSYLQAAHRYEAEHPKNAAPLEMPFPDVEFPVYIVQQRQDFIASLGYTVLQFAAEHNDGIHDSDVFAALTPLAEAYRTLSSGIYFERAPDAAVPNALYRKLAEFVKHYQEEDARNSRERLKDTQIFYLLVFFLRFGRHQTNGRTLSRGFIETLRAQLPRPAAQPEPASRIIMP